MTTQTIKLPTNAAAEEVRRLRGVNSDLEEQIRTLRKSQSTNSELIGHFASLATWEEVPDPSMPDPEEEEPTPEPEPEPETEPEPEPEPEPGPEPVEPELPEEEES